MRRPDRRTILRALTLLPFSTAPAAVSVRAQSLGVFQRGWNHPWIGYGHDFGRAWGHDGLSTSGWTCETDPTALGFTDSEVTIDPESGRGALRIRAQLLGGHPNRSRGGVYLSLVDHWPFACPPPARRAALNLDGVVVRYRIRLPKGSAGSPEAPNGVQLVLKTRLSAERWPALFTTPVAIGPAWEAGDVEIAVRLDARSAVYADPGFDITDVSLIGLVMTIDPRAPSPVDGTIWLDQLALDTDPPVIFDFDHTELDAQFAAVGRRKGRGLSLVRFFIFCDGRAAPAFAPDGSVSGLDSVFYRDFDVLVGAAERHGVFLVPVLLDFGWCAYPTTVSGVQLGGHADVIRDAGKRQSFLERALKPLLERYGRHPAIFAWDVCNEPERIIDEIPEAFRRNHDVVSLADMRAFVQSCAAYVHRLTATQLLTVGSARRKWLQLWTGSDLDFYQFHWYDDFQSEEPFPWRSYDELGLDKPCLIGEVPTDNTSFTLQDFIAAAEAGGYSGVLFWSYGARDAFSNLCSRRDDGPTGPRPVPPHSQVRTPTRRSPLGS